jgi:hypothetical protein
MQRCLTTISLIAIGTLVRQGLKPFSLLQLERPKAEALGYLEAKTVVRARRLTRGRSSEAGVHLPRG